MSLESGIGGSTASGSSLEFYFNSILPDLEKKIGQLDDEPIGTTPIKNREVAIHQPGRTNDPVMEELESLKSVFDRGGRYGDKLATIMMNGLQQTLGNGIYEMFLANRLPENWYPIIRMNNDNTPYVEFIIKSDLADQEPDSQFSDYTMAHIMVSQRILACLQKSSKPKSEPQPKSFTPSLKKIRQYPEQMACSTPRKTVVNRPNQPKVDLNDSKRILPARACKSSKKTPTSQN